MMTKTKTARRRTFTIEMLQGWRYRLPKAIEAIAGGLVLRQGYGDDTTTTWVVVASFPAAMREAQVREALYAVTGCGGWMVVTEQAERRGRQ